MLYLHTLLTLPLLCLPSRSNHRMTHNLLYDTYSLV